MKPTTFSTLALVAVLFFSCNSGSNFSGTWLDKKYEQEILKINKQDNNYIIEIANSKYPCKIKDGIIEILSTPPINGTIMGDSILLINGNEYIRYENSLTNRFIGSWKGFNLSYGSKGPEPYGNEIYCKIEKDDKSFRLFDICDNHTYSMRLNDGKLVGRVGYTYKMSSEIVLEFNSSGKLFWLDPMGSKEFEKVNSLDNLLEAPKSFKDLRDGKEYKVVKIGEQIWMAEDFNLNGQKLFTQNEAQNNAPDGWHLPTKSEWEKLFEFVGGDKGKRDMIDGSSYFVYYGAVVKLKSKSGWTKSSSTDEFSFSSLPTAKSEWGEYVNYITASLYEKYNNSNDPYYIQINSREDSYLGERKVGKGIFYRGRSDEKYTVRYVRNNCPK